MKILNKRNINFLKVSKKKKDILFYCFIVLKVRLYKNSILKELRNIEEIQSRKI